MPAKHDINEFSEISHLLCGGLLYEASGGVDSSGIKILDPSQIIKW